MGVKNTQDFGSLFTESNKLALQQNKEAKSILRNISESELKETMDNKIDYKTFFYDAMQQLEKQEREILSSIEKPVDSSQLIMNDPHKFQKWLNDKGVNLETVSSNQVIKIILEKINFESSRKNLLFEKNVSIPLVMAEITFYYNLLNLCGYHMDDYRSLKKGDRFNASQNDMNHASVGYYANFLITNDSKMALKSRAIYEFMKIRTKVVTPKEFIMEFEV